MAIYKVVATIIEVYSLDVEAEDAEEARRVADEIDWEAMGPDYRTEDYDIS